MPEEKPATVFYTFATAPESMPAIGNAGLSDEQQEMGYVATLCFVVGLDEAGGPRELADVHVTLDHMRKLRYGLDVFIRYEEQKG